MFNDLIKHYLPNKMSKVGLTICLLAFFITIIVLSITSYYGVLTGKEIITGFIFAGGIGAISIGISFISLGVARGSKLIAEGTDRKIDEFHNAFFQGIISIFEDRRLDTILNDEIIHINLWKAYVDLKQAKVMFDSLNIEHDNLVTMINRFNDLMDRVITIENKLLCEDVSHIIKMYNIVTELNINDRYEHLKEVAKVKLRTFFHLEENVEITNEYITQVQNNITDEIRWHLFDTHRYEIVDTN